jgi:hypothetical protein
VGFWTTTSSSFGAVQGGTIYFTMAKPGMVDIQYTATAAAVNRKQTSVYALHCDYGIDVDGTVASYVMTSPALDDGGSDTVVGHLVPVAVRATVSLPAGSHTASAVMAMRTAPGIAECGMHQLHMLVAVQQP